MAVERSDIRFVKSATVTDTSANGGKLSYTQVQNRVKYNLFPRVTRPERVAGITRFRKEFIWNREASGETAFDIMVYIILPSLADDHFRIAAGDQTDTQYDVVTGDPDGYKWFGGGALNAGVSAGDSSIDIMFEDDDVDLENGQMLCLNSHFMLSQDVDSAVRAFNQVYWNGTKWVVQSAPTEDQEDVYPYGTCIQLLGGDLANIFSYNSDGDLEYHRIDDPTYTENMSPAPTGGVYSYTLTVANFPILRESVSIEYTVSGSDYTVTDDGDGNITGSFISVGSVNYDTGYIALTFTAPNNPTAGTQIVVTYHENVVSWAGNVATVQLEDTLLNDFLSVNTKVGMCLELGDLIASIEEISTTFGNPSASIDTDEMYGDNLGSVEDTWTLSFYSTTQYSVVGSAIGSVGSSQISSNFNPTNADQSAPYFTIPTTAWDGTSYQAGDVVIFKTHPAAAAIWWKEVVPSATDPFSNNVVMLEAYIE